MDIFYSSTITTPIGDMTIVATKKGLYSADFSDSLEGLYKKFPNAVVKPDETYFEPWHKVIKSYFYDSKALPKLTLDLHGTEFQIKVWESLQTIPIGSTISYKDLANYIGKPKAIRAVASACANNKIAVLIPCHRVVASSGKLAGYRWGLERKEKLLALERAV